MSSKLQFFFLNFSIAYAVTVSKFSELFIYAATVFFLPELILHKYSVEGYSNYFASFAAEFPQTSSEMVILGDLVLERS